MTVRFEDLMYNLDPATRELLKESAPMMAKWAATECKPKPVGGMEEWAKEHANAEDSLGCDWYHGTWQYLRLLNMVAVPAWYEFYNEALSTILKRKPDAHVLISACADYGMLSTLHEGIKTAKTNPKITIYDICQTPLLSCKWYAERFGLTIECIRDNIITSPKMPLHAFDLIVTDEFLTVLKDEYKPQIVRRWKELLKPGGSIVTTAMLGGPTDQGLRDGYAANARALFEKNKATFDAMDVVRDDLFKRFDYFAQVHTRHMLGHENQIRKLFSDFDLTMSKTVTPGECVNPTSSYQIVATLR